MTSKNVLIPFPLLDQIIDFLEELRISEYHPLSYDCANILWALRVKKQKLELRDAYAKIIAAESDDDMLQARMQYLSQKRLLLVDQEPF